MTKRIVFCLLILCIFQGLAAKGAQDTAEYRVQQESLFKNVIQSVGSGEMTAAAAKQSMEELRSRFSRPYTDEDGIIDSFIDQVSEKLITPEEALGQFSFLRSGELMVQRKNAENGTASQSENENDSRSGGTSKPGSPGKTPTGGGH